MTATGLRISDLVEHFVVDRARAAAPREACGLLLGERARVADVVELANVARGLDRFDLDPAGFVRAASDARARGLDVVGVWHSHPDGSLAPSAADLAGALRGERAWSHLIVALDHADSSPDSTRADLASYRLAGPRLVREPITRIPASAVENVR